MLNIDPEVDYYATLGVTEDVSQDEVRLAYRRLAKETHPDASAGDAGLFRKIREAYDVLSTVEGREAYDRLRVARGRDSGHFAMQAMQSRVRLPVAVGEQMLYLTLDLVPRPVAGASRRPLNLVLVIDRSTSMRGVRMQNVRTAITELIGSLTPDDRLALVAFSDRAEVLAPSATVSNPVPFRSALMSIVPAGGTELYQGLAVGIDQAKPHTQPGVISHVLLFTDGRTYGDEELALQAAARAHAAGIGLSAFGIGEDWHDAFLLDLARHGGGTSHYIDAPGKVREVLCDRVKELGTFVLNNVRARVGLAPGVRLVEVYRALPITELLEADSSGGYALGSLTAGVTVVLALEFAVELAGIGPHRVARVTIEGEDAGTGEPVSKWHDVLVTSTPDAGDTEVPSRLVGIMARLSIYGLQERAWRALERGSPEQATQDLEAAATSLFDLGFRELGQAAMLEAARLNRGDAPSSRGRKQLRYGTRALGEFPS